MARSWCALLLCSLLAIPVTTGCDEIQKRAKEEENRRRGDDLVVEGAKAYQLGNYTEAIETLEKALELGLKYKEVDEVESIIGNAFLQLDEFDKAALHQKKALEHNPKNHAAMVNLGATYRQMNKLDEAEKMYTQAAALAPDYPELHASLGALYLVKGEPEKSETSLRRALELDDSLAIAHANLSLTLANLGRFEDADVSVKRATELGYKNGDLVRRQIDDLKKKASP